MTPKPDAPHSPDAERAILGAILLDNAAAQQVAQLDTRDLFLDSNRVLLTVMREMLDAGTAVDLVTLAQQLMDAGQFEQIGGAGYISSLTDNLPKLSNIGHYINIVQEKARQRQMMAAGYELAERAALGDTSVSEALVAAVPVSGNGKHAEKVLRVPESAWCDLGRVYLEAVRHTTSASENYHFAVFLAVAGAVLGRSIHYNDGELYPNFFMGLVGESSYAKKGTAMRYGKRLLKDIGAPVVWLMSVDSAAGFTKELTTRQAEAKSKEILCVLHFPELRSLIDKANREGSRDIIPKLSEAYDCEDLQRVVVGGSGMASNTFTALLGGAAPEWLTNLSESDLKGGIGNRFCWIPGEEREPLHKRPPIDQTLWNRVVRSLHEAMVYWHGERGERLPTEITLSAEADEKMESYGKALYRDTRGEVLIRELCGRLEGHCIKTAMVYAALERSPVILGIHVDKAIMFCEFLLKGLYGIFSKFGLSEVVKQERRIMELVEQAGGVISQRTLQRKLPRMDGETFQRRIRWLVGEENYLTARRDGKTTYLYLNK